MKADTTSARLEGWARFEGSARFKESEFEESAVWPKESNAG